MATGVSKSVNVIGVIGGHWPTGVWPVIQSLLAERLFWCICSMWQS